MAYADINGFRMWYDVRGSGRPVLFIHGGLAGLPSRLEPRDYTWLEEIADAYRLIVYHRRGCGWSSCPEDGWRLEDFVADALALLDHLGVEQAHVIGSSAGGPIAILLALRYRERVRGLALVNTAAYLFREDGAGGRLLRLAREQLALLESEGPLAVWRRRPPGVRLSLLGLWEREVAAASGALADYEAYEERLSSLAAALSEEEQARLYAAELRNIASYLGRDLRPLARQLEVPALVLHGSEDRVIPLEEARELAALVPGAELVVVPGAPHGILGASQEARRAVVDFLRRVDGALDRGEGG